MYCEATLCTIGAILAVPSSVSPLPLLETDMYEDSYFNDAAANALEERLRNLEADEDEDEDE